MSESLSTINTTSVDDSADNIVGTTTNRHNQWRTILINCGGVKGKTPNLHALIDDTKPDCIIGNETWLDETIKNGAIFPKHYTIFWKDRNINGGGVFIGIKEGFTATRIATTDTEIEIMWVSVKVSQASKTFYIGSFYRPPSDHHTKLDELRKSISLLPGNASEKNIILGGDFNAPGIDWENEQPGTNNIALNQHVLDIVKEYSLTQVQLEPTRKQNILDLIFTSNQTLVQNVQTIPGISDHCAVMMDSSIHPVYTKKAQRKIYTFSLADWEAIQTELEVFSTAFVRTENQ